MVITPASATNERRYRATIPFMALLRGFGASTVNSSGALSIDSSRVRRAQLWGGVGSAAGRATGPSCCGLPPKGVAGLDVDAERLASGTRRGSQHGHPPLAD